MTDKQGLTPAMKTKTIDGITFMLEPVGAWEAYPLFHSLVSIVGGMTSVLSDLMKEREDGKKLAIGDVNLQKFFEELPGFLQRAEPAEFRRLTEMMLLTCHFRPPAVKGKQGETLPLLDVFDEAMKGKLLTTFKLVAWAIQVNFSDFFSGVMLATAAKKAAASSEAPANGTSSPSSEPTSAPAA